MSYHPFERICSLYLERIKKHFVIENYPIRYGRRGKSKHSPSTGTTDYDLISFDPKHPKVIHLFECKSHINKTFTTNSRTRLLKQLKNMKKYFKYLPYKKKTTKSQRWVFSIDIAKRVLDKIPKNVIIKQGENFEKEVLDKLILYVAKDPKIDPKDDILSIIRLFWHFGLFKEKYYLERTRAFLKDDENLTPKELRNELGLISYKTEFCRNLLNKCRN